MFALLAALVLLLPSAASAHTEYYCRMMGRIIGAASCANEAAHAASPTTELRVADCCQRLKSATGTASLGTRDAVPDFTAVCHASAPAPSFELGAPSGPHSVCAASTQAPLAIGPPLFLAHCALLS